MLGVILYISGSMKWNFGAKLTACCTTCLSYLSSVDSSYCHTSYLILLIGFKVKCTDELVI